MKILLISLFIFVFQTDTVKVDTVHNLVIQQADRMNRKLDSIIIELEKDTIKKK
jgi:hypothetical protein